MNKWWSVANVGISLCRQACQVLSWHMCPSPFSNVVQMHKTLASTKREQFWIPQTQNRNATLIACGTFRGCFRSLHSDQQTRVIPLTVMPPELAPVTNSPSASLEGHQLPHSISGSSDLKTNQMESTKTCQVFGIPRLELRMGCASVFRFLLVALLRMDDTFLNVSSWSAV
jgi:hypothetical protein